MKVAFWNGISGTDSVACYVAAIGMLLAKEYKCNVVLSSNYISNRMMQDCFSKRMLEEGIAHTPYCYLYGSPEYYGALWRMKRNRQGNILEMPIKKMTILYPPDMDEKSMFYCKVPDHSFYLLDMAKCSISKSVNVLDEAELVVVFLSQDETEIRNFFERFSSLIPKALFVIVDYQRDTGYSCRKIKEEYGINSNNIETMPKNERFYMMCEEGNMERFIMDNLYQRESENDGLFMAALKKITKKICMRGICL